MNRTHPQNFDIASFDSAKLHSAAQRGCCNDCSVYFPCTRRCVCVTIIALLVLGIIVAIIALVVTVGIPPHTPVNRLCITTSNQTGFLCDNREVCVPASQVCDTRRNCINGEDEQETLCSNIPNSLPGYLIFYCGNGRFWIYADKRCDGFNDCGDCSDELGSKASCPPCRPERWRCTSVFHDYCDCLPRILCQDGKQDCNDWSDEYICKRWMSSPGLNLSGNNGKIAEQKETEKMIKLLWDNRAVRCFTTSMHFWRVFKLDVLCSAMQCLMSSSQTAKPSSLGDSLFRNFRGL